MIGKTLKRQPRAKAMLPAIRQLIALRATEDPNKDRQILAEELIKEIKEKYPGEIPPVEETLIKKISEARNSDVNPLDTPWHLGKLNSNVSDISADAVKRILDIHKMLSKTKRITRREPLHTRQILWINRLHSFIPDNRDLYSASYIYALQEIICEISKTPFDTTKLDEALCKSVNDLRKLGLDMSIKENDLSFQAFSKMRGIKKDGEK